MVMSLPAVVVAADVEPALAAEYATLANPEADATDQPEQEQSDHSQGARPGGVVPRTRVHLSVEQDIPTLQPLGTGLQNHAGPCSCLKF